MKSKGKHIVVDLKKHCTPLSVDTKQHFSAKKWNTSAQRCKAYVLKYFNRSGLHGLSYVGDVRRPFIERFLWLFVFCVSLIVCSFLIRSVWIKWTTTPIIVTYADTPTPVWEVPFPAVTVCGQNKIGKAIFSYAYGTRFGIPGTPAFAEYPLPPPPNLEPDGQNVPYTPPPVNYFDESLGANGQTATYNLTGAPSATQGDTATQPSTEGKDIRERQKRFIDLSQWCNEDAFEAEKNITDYRIIKRIKEEAPSLNQTIGFVKWKNHEVHVEKYFRPILTQNGLCYTFNMLDDDDIYRDEVLAVMKRNNDGQTRARRTPHWSTEGGYSKGSGFNTYPARAPGSGLYGELYFMLKGNELVKNYICKGPVHGFKVQVHSPAEVPAFSKQYFRVPLGDDMAVAVRPSTLSTAAALRGYSPQHRQCFFSDERYLRFFREYSQGNCELECYANETLRLCGCVSFFSPRTEDTPICNARHKDCLKQLGEQRVERVVLRYEERGDLRGLLDVTGCDCLPSCTALSYDVDTSQADVDADSYETAIKRLNSSFEYRILGLSVYFKHTLFFGRSRSELYGITDFIANCGGLLGLFMGFSILSLVEVIYFFTIRLGFSVSSKRNKSTQTTKVDEVNSTHL